MSNYGQYSNYYDPVGSQPHQPTGYTYKANGSSAWPNSAPEYGQIQPSFSSNAYNNQQYAVSQSDHRGAYNATADADTTDRANPLVPSGRRNTPVQNNSTNLYGHNPNPVNYSSHQVPQPRHLQTTPSPIYSDRTPSSTGIPGAVNNYKSSRHPSVASTGESYQQTYPLTDPRSHPRPFPTPLFRQRQINQQSQPEPFQSQLNVAQAPAHGLPTADMDSNNRLASPQQSSDQYRGASAEASHATVNPSQVYDNRAELQRQAQLDAERKQRREAEIRERRAEEERIAAEKQHVVMEKQRLEERQRLEEQQRAEEQRRNDHVKTAAEDAAMKKREQQAKRNERRAKAREEQRKSKTAASALQSLAASGAGRPVSNEAPSIPDSAGDDEEAQMRAMFKKMREFNSKNPTMLAKLWEEERRTHTQSQTSPNPGTAPSPPAQPQVPPRIHSPAVNISSSASPATQNVPVPIPPPKAATPDIKPAEQPSLYHRQNSSAGPALGYWPNQTRGVLAEAAARWLQAIPQNSSRVIDARFILEMFNANPSYVQLCQVFESKGWKFDRSALARVLLKASPDTGKAAPPSSLLDSTNSIASRPAADVRGSSSIVQESGVYLGNDARYEQGMVPNQSTNTTVNYETPLALTEVARAVNAALPQVTTELGYTILPQTQPEIKQETSQAPPRPPVDKEEAARKRTFGDLVDLTAGNSDDDEPPPKKVMHEAPAGNGNISTVPQEHGGQPPSGLWKPLAFSDFIRRAPGKFVPGHDAAGAPVVLPSNDQRPPPPPSQPQPPSRPAKVKPHGPSQEQIQHSRLRGKMLVEPIMRDRVARKSRYDSRTIARDVLLATGRHPDMRPLNGHLFPMQKLLGHHGAQVDQENRTNLRCDLATIRWDIIDPGGSTDSDTSHHDSQTPRPWNNFHDFASSTQNPTTTHEAASAQITKQSTSPITNGLGEHTARQTVPKAQRVTSSTATPDGGAKMSQHVGYAAFRSGDPTAPKKKGRPFGWRKSLHSREAAGLPSATLPSRTRDSQLPSGEAQVEPTYQVYKCRWVQCGAELHNFETLKKHMVKVHGRPADNDRYPCRWRKCVVGDFEDIDTWLKHMDTQHLQPIAWKLGDGPRGGSLKDSYPDSESYLSDSRGRSVTPIISVVSTKDSQNSDPAHIRANTISWPNRVGRPSMNPNERSAIEELKDLERHKLAVGPVLDRQGCVLASEERRRTFLEDEDFEDEVEGSEHESMKDMV